MTMDNEKYIDHMRSVVQTNIDRSDAIDDMRLLTMVRDILNVCKVQQQEIKDLRKMINHIEPASRYEWWQKQIGIKPEGI